MFVRIRSEFKYYLKKKVTIHVFGRIRSEFQYLKKKKKKGTIPVFGRNKVRIPMFGRIRSDSNIN